MNKSTNPLHVKHIARTALAVALAGMGSATTHALAQTNSEAPAPRMVFAQTNHLKATVQDIDYAKREVTLKGPNGKSVQVAISDEVRNFPQMKKGDIVNVGYYESVALALGKPGEVLPATSRSETLARRAPGQKPGGLAVTVTQTTATVEDVDREKREVTLKGPEGNTVTLEVDPSVGNLQRIKKGDTITANRTEALAISVEPSDAKSDSETK
jgi:Cu/Ag efflux protein CusF